MFTRFRQSGTTVLQKALFTSQLCSSRGMKHWDPKWRKFRAQKIIKVDLPDFQKKVEEFSEQDQRAWMRKRGIEPRLPWVEKPITINSTGSIFEGYVPPEGDGKVSPIQLQGVKQQMQFLQKKTRTMMAIRKIRSFEEQFDTPEFCREAERIYIKLHRLLADRNLDDLTDYCTERAYPELIHNVNRKTIRWQFLKNIELPRVVHARTTHVLTRDNCFAQLTVRFHTQQTLAVYDRFGRLVLGSEYTAKDVLEYVIFEKHLANQYGVWRLHAKIIPDWLPKREPALQTFQNVQLDLGKDDDDDLADKDGASAEPDVAITETTAMEKEEAIEDGGHQGGQLPPSQQPPPAVAPV